MCIVCIVYIFWKAPTAICALHYSLLLLDLLMLLLCDWQVTKGPQVQVRLCAEVTMPSLTVSTDTLQFDIIQWGLCQVITVQLHNDGPVPCEWSIRQEERPKKVQALYRTYKQGARVIFVFGITDEAFAVRLCSCIKKVNFDFMLTLRDSFPLLISLFSLVSNFIYIYICLIWMGAGRSVEIHSSLWRVCCC